MADSPHTAAPRARPLSPHLSIYRWPTTMASSITHRATGVALTVGTLFLAWWLIAAASGPDAYATFNAAAHSVIGLIILFGFVWSLSFHFLNGIRHLAWDLGYGFKVPGANRTSTMIFVLSVLIAIAVFACGLVGAGRL
ncbi:MAG: succinate dehydrogenase, cytochrome b556 subunit [Alphaproteobacteria bacterium]|nr:succinate dehydrogenase, cytochrome b556 subunit [Alphaproteobacteria bacterium]OJU58146.1 MAG: succinate dehydrogenase, cytochrome b556 subunit [Alphaproteobacteria bacterium 62-8]MBN9558559.1 succinate dehydrogenase, cytochrome b556 subunit [Alphaproteobacteria bacterium]MBN9566374.1 succinate dehydrogenase, cytochrome b556 subunit [Alphaproteobacteria bacterium]MBN9578613.1 succinate dehydrogenase, cytochrome b556 subunit [Alphaproteobacteria bacterium]